MAKRSCGARLLVSTFFLSVATSLLSQQPQKSSPAITQQILDILARPGQPTNTTKPLPSLYADWSEDQRRNGPRQVAGRCNVLWVMMNDAGPIKLLPAAQSPADTNKLPLETCIAAHMPADWPGRPAAIADIKRILTRSTELGLPLTLPPTLTR